MEPGYRYNVITSFHELAALRPEWQRAFDASPDRCVTTAPAWTHGLLCRYNGRRAMRIIVVRRGERLALVFPYVADEPPVGPALIEGLCEIVPFFTVSADPPLFAFLLDELERLHGRLRLTLTQIDRRWGSVAMFLETLAARGARVRIEKTHDNVLVDTGQGWEQLVAGLSANAREGLRKARRRATADASSYTVRQYRDPSEIHRGIEEIMAVDGRSWKHARGGAMCRSDNEDVQFAAAIEKFADAGAARLFVLHIEEIPVAFIIAFVVERTAYFAIWSYADFASHFMPGKLLMASALEQLAADGIASVDFWGRNDRFKSSWSRITVPRHRIIAATGRPPLGELIAPAIGAARAIGRPVAEFFRGDPERYRLRHDRPSYFERFIRDPVMRPLIAAAQWKRYTRCDLGAMRHDDTVGVEAVPASPLDRFHLGDNFFGRADRLLAFRRHGRLMGGIVLAPFAGAACRRVEYLRFLDGDPDLWRACLSTLPVVMPGLRYLYEGRSGEWGTSVRDILDADRATRQKKVRA